MNNLCNKVNKLWNIIKKDNRMLNIKIKLLKERIQNCLFVFSLDK